MENQANGSELRKNLAELEDCLGSQRQWRSLLEATKRRQKDLLERVLAQIGEAQREPFALKNKFELNERETITLINVLKVEKRSGISPRT